MSRSISREEILNKLTSMRAKFDSSGINLQASAQDPQSSKTQARESPKRSYSPYLPGSPQRS